MTGLPGADRTRCPGPWRYTDECCRWEKNVEHTTEPMITIVRGGAEYARLTLRGSFDHHAAQRLRTQLGAVLDTGARYLTVDLSDVSCCDENVFDLLGWAERRAFSKRGWLALNDGHRRIQFVSQRPRLEASNSIAAHCACHTDPSWSANRLPHERVIG